MRELLIDLILKVLKLEHILIIVIVMVVVVMIVIYRSVLVLIMETVLALELIEGDGGLISTGEGVLAEDWALVEVFRVVNVAKELSIFPFIVGRLLVLGSHNGFITIWRVIVI